MNQLINKSQAQYSDPVNKFTDAHPIKDPGPISEWGGLFFVVKKNGRPSAGIALFRYGKGDR